MASAEDSASSPTAEGSASSPTAEGSAGSPAADGSASSPTFTITAEEIVKLARVLGTRRGLRLPTPTQGADEPAGIDPKLIGAWVGTLLTPTHEELSQGIYDFLVEDVGRTVDDISSRTTD